ncbi:hypothetical protein AB1Y20_010129 [Prymnesium parvum]|uniref:SprT-like domain-containing protein n=1 Tax=Prymnesium parvum TaxID=97485 RepID=A0AB34K813_PRYPA
MPRLLTHALGMRSLGSRCHSFHQIVGLQGDVLDTMASIALLKPSALVPLDHLPVSRLRRDAFKLHGVCRFRRTGDDFVAHKIALHPELLDDERWHGYARFVLYHEYLHALGFRRHNSTFRTLERLWDYTPLGRADAAVLEVASSGGTLSDAKPPIRELGAWSFTNHLIARQYPWTWVCPNCKRLHHRKRRQNGRLTCANPIHARGTPLFDVPTVEAIAWAPRAMLRATSVSD